MAETMEIVHLLSKTGVPVTVAAADVEHYLNVGFVHPPSAAQPEPEPEPEVEPEPELEVKTPAVDVDELAEPTTGPEQTPKRGGKK